MKKALIMITVSLFPRLLAAQELNVDSLIGENWYGLYIQGHKSGYSVNSVAKDAQGVVTVTEDAHIRVSMVSAKQDMRIYSKRTYAPDGALVSIESAVDDPSGKSKFFARMDGDALVLETTLGGETKSERRAKPKETLRDALKQADLTGRGGKVGNSLSYSWFEPVYKMELSAKSSIIAEEERVLEGVSTKVFKIKTVIEQLGVETSSFVAQDGTTLEDVIGGNITMRLEPKDLAKDVNYSNDVIVSNAAKVLTPIANPRDRTTLHLLLHGPLTSEHVYNDDRQSLTPAGDGFDFKASRVSLKGITVAHIPVTAPEAVEWTKPTTFVQSDSPKLVSKAREIVGAETDAVKVSDRLCAWVYQNVHTEYSARLSNALEVLENPKGDCTEHSILFIGLARAVGLPAREVAGMIYVDGPDAGFYFHQWATVWVGKWIDVDPTFNQPLADVTHIKLGEGDLFKQAKLIPLIGQIKVEVAK
ncbi:MAG: transglutaminase domain-containing protein [Candidatus Hydrogenedentes bacterium]|nr:transglutaminase domain-containing protein [Candidatus Hydrogenedentota bacterium]